MASRRTSADLPLHALTTCTGQQRSSWECLQMLATRRAAAKPPCSHCRAHAAALSGTQAYAAQRQGSAVNIMDDTATLAQPVILARTAGCSAAPAYASGSWTCHAVLKPDTCGQLSRWRIMRSCCDAASAAHPSQQHVGDGVVEAEVGVGHEVHHDGDLHRCSIPYMMKHCASHMTGSFGTLNAAAAAAGIDSARSATQVLTRHSAHASPTSRPTSLSCVHDVLCT
jgi:hypothetical protein